MKKLFALSSCTLLLFSACSKVPDFSDETLVAKGSFQTKSGIEIISNQLDTTFFVNTSDIESYTKFRMLLAHNQGRDLSVQSISPIGPTEDVILCYLVNYNDGWEVIAADRRAPTVLAMQETGNIDLGEISSSEPLQDMFSWIGYLASDVLVLRYDSDYIPKDPEDKKGMETCLSFWSCITEPEKVIVDPELQTKALDIIPAGHWELTNTYVETIDYAVYDYCGTSWSQGSPYNAYAPLKSNGTNLHAPLGCTAVAGGQMLYSLYQQFGVPETIPTGILYGGDVDHYFSYFSNYSSSGWTMIDFDSDSEIATLLAYIGSLLPNNWGNYATGASIENLKNNVFQALGYDCVLSDYVASTALSSLQYYQQPIVMAAWDGVFYFLGCPIYWRAEGHCFLIDKYKKVQSKTTYVYEWVYDNIPSGSMIELIDPRVEVVYGAPYTSGYIGMNWGAAGYYDDVWYQANGNWNALGYDFDDMRKMMYAFSVSEQE